MSFRHLLGCDTIGLHKVEHGVTKREATPPFPSKFYMSQIIE